MSLLQRDIRNVLPSFRSTRREMWRWAAVSEYAQEAEQGVSLLADMAGDYGAAEVIPVVQKAISSTFTVLMRADDSGGMIQLVIGELLNLHAELCAESPPAPAVLSTWIQKQQFGEFGSYFDIDVRDYAEAFGERGLATFERHLSKRREALTTPFDGRPEAGFARDEESDARRALLYNLQRLAVLGEDEDAIVRTHGGDLPKAYRRAEAAKALWEAGFLPRAASVAREGVSLDGASHQQHECAKLWRDILVELRSPDASDAAAEVFARWPTASAAKEWELSTTDWSKLREVAISELRRNAKELIAYLLDAGDVDRAWHEAHLAVEAGQSLLPTQWDELVVAYSKIDPVAVLPVMARLIDGRLVEANTKAYPGAVKRMRELRKAALAVGRPEFASSYLDGIRERYARRSSLIARMDAARL